MAPKPMLGSGGRIGRLAVFCGFRGLFAVASPGLYPTRAAVTLPAAGAVAERSMARS